MSETEGLMAQAEVESESENNQQTEENTIDHLVDENGQAPQPVEADSEEVEMERPDWFPEKFWSEEDGPDLESLTKSYAELQKKFSQGKHKAPEQYETTIFTEANIPEDDALLNTYTDWAKKHGISQGAFEELATQFVEMAGEEANLEKISYDEELKKLGPNADATIKSMTEWAQGLVRKGVWGEDDFEEFKIMGGTAQGLRALQKVRSFYGDQPIPVDVGPAEGLPSKDELTAMVGKPEYATDPTYRNKVEKLFEQVYGKADYEPTL